MALALTFSKMKISPLVVAVLIPLSSLCTLNAAEPTAPEPTAPGAAEQPVKTASEAPASNLTWEKQKVEIETKLGENIARANYRFTNTGKDPVSLVEITPSCGCVATEVAKLDFAPGESGVMKVTLDLENADDADLQDRTIVITTSDAPKNPTTLRFIVHVPSPFEATPKSVAWNRGDKPTAQDVLITAGPGVDDLKLHLESTNGDFSVELKPEIEGKSYHVSIVPTNTSAMAYAHLRFVAESPAFPKPLPCEIDARVR